MKNLTLKSAKAALTAIVAIAAALFSTASCGPKEGNILKGIELYSHEVDLTSGSNSYLICCPVPENAELPLLIWSSDDEDVVTVDCFGNITAGDMPGETMIHVSTEDGRFRDECRVKVVVDAKGIKISHKEINVETGGNATLSAEVTPKGASQEVSWDSVNPDIATVDANGLVHGNAVGQTKVIVKSVMGGFTDECTVNVTSYVALEGLVLDRVKLGKGESKVAPLTYIPANTTRTEVVWQSSNPDIIEVSKGGVLTGHAEGIATITVTSKDGRFTASCDIAVVDNYIRYRSTAGNFSFTITPSDGSCWIDLNGNGLLDPDETVTSGKVFTNKASTTYDIYGPVTRFDCSNQHSNLVDISNAAKLERLMASDNPGVRIDSGSKNKNLQFIAAYGCGIKASDSFGSSLPNVSNGTLIFKNLSPYAKDDNEMTPEDVQKAINKGWKVQCRANQKMIDYPGNYKIQMNRYGQGTVSMYVICEGDYCWIDINNDSIAQDNELTIKSGWNSFDNVSGSFTAHGKFTSFTCKGELLEANTANCPSLKDLDLSQNRLSTLDITKNTLLETLRVQQNKLTSVKFPSSSKLTTIYCYENYLLLDYMDTFISGLPSAAGSTKEIHIINLDNGITNSECNMLIPSQADMIKKLGWKLVRYKNGLSAEMTSSEYDKYNYIDFTTAKTTLNYSVTTSNAHRCFLINETSGEVYRLKDYPTSVSNSAKSNFRMTGDFSAVNLSGNNLEGRVEGRGDGISRLNVSNNQIKALVVNRLWDLSELYCERNTITNIYIDNRQTKLCFVSCYLNRLVSDTIEANWSLNSILKNLPAVNNSGSTDRVIVCVSEDSAEQNRATKTYVNTARSNGWGVYKISADGTRTSGYSGE